MAALAILTDAGLSVQLTADGGLFVAPAARLTDDLRQYIRSHKADILAELAANDPDQQPATKAADGSTPPRAADLWFQPCGQCVHRRSPGAAWPGYCASRDDLPLAYGLLHYLPDDLGDTCGAFKPRG